MNTIIWACKIFLVLGSITIISIFGVALLALVPGIIFIYVGFKVGGFFGGFLLVVGLMGIGVAIIFLKEAWFPTFFD